MNLGYYSLPTTAHFCSLRIVSTWACLLTEKIRKAHQIHNFAILYPPNTVILQTYTMQMKNYSLGKMTNWGRRTSSLLGRRARRTNLC